jgi:hypothetical protein
MRLPFGLGRIGTPKPWKRADAAAAAMVINDVFGVGGGGELGAARALRALQDRLGTQAGMALYEDLRIPDPGATTHTATPSPYPVFAAKEGGGRGPAGAPPPPPPRRSRCRTPRLRCRPPTCRRPRT